MRYYSVIYAAIDEIEAALKGMLKPIYEEKQLGMAQIRDIFRSSKFGNIAGCMVTSGLMRRNAKARLIRDGVVVQETSIASLRREKDDATEVRPVELQRHPDRRRDRNLRNGGEAARLNGRLTTASVWGGASDRFAPLLSPHPH